jgi:beta-lactam-binding protein with PASTA domain
MEMSGIVGMPSQVHGRHVVPDVVGATLLEATKRIQAAGLPWGVMAPPLPPTRTYNVYASYCITDQTPDAGTVVSSTPNDQVWLVHLRADPCPHLPLHPTPRD